MSTKTRYPIVMLLMGALVGLTALFSQLFVQPTPAQTLAPGAAQVVEQFYPQRLVAESEEDFRQGGPPPFRASGFLQVDLESAGVERFIVAAYTNGFSAVVRVLKRQNGGFVLVDEPNLRLMAGVFPQVERLDLDNDGRPEIVVRFSSARGPRSTWIFRWTGAQLVPIGPLSVDENGDVSTELTEASFIDVDGDGTLEIVQPESNGPVAPGETEITFSPPKIYRLTGGRFVFDQELIFLASFTRGTGPPQTESRSFSVPASAGAFVVKIVNGERGGRNRVSSARIRLNGTSIAGPSDFNQQVGSKSVQVLLKEENVLEAELASKPGGKLTILVSPVR